MKRLTTEEFKRKFREKYGEIYNLDKVEYINNKTEVVVTCPIHGDFRKRPDLLMSEAKCPKCSKENVEKKSNKTYDTESFKEKVRSIYGDKYLLDNVVYVNAQTKIAVGCKEHGIFYITPNHLLRGRGCPKCSKNYHYSTEEIIDKFREIHGEKYSYEKVKYVSTHKKVIVTCKEHGDFKISPSNHLKGQGCPMCRVKKKKCNIEKKDKKKVVCDKKEIFVKKARKVHGDKYDYSKVNYIDSQTRVCIICPKHGEFWQRPNAHIDGRGCPKCGQEKSTVARRLTREMFIEKAKDVHGDKYDYSKVEYTNNSTKICIICPQHGEFWQTPCSHLTGQGCPKCAINKRGQSTKLNTEIFIKRAREVHGDRYNYSKVNYINANTKVCIICPTHGEFWQMPYAHLNGCGCSKCSEETRGQKVALTTEEFIKRAREVHGDKYNYSQTNYTKAKELAKIICPIHGEFWQTPDSHLHGSGCPRCSLSKSAPEEEISSFLAGLYDGVINKRDRRVIPPYEIDIFLPSIKVGIEYNGLIWHSERFNKDKDYHLNKLNMCNEKGIKLISIFEDEWKYKNEIVKNKIKHLLQFNNEKEKLYARKCEIREIDKCEANIFLEKYHIQGKTGSSINYGSFFNNKLIGVMSFKKLNNKNDWELVRFATDSNFVCCGVGGKLFNFFVKKNNPNTVKSFADRRWTVEGETNLYTKIGFKLDKILPPDYKYVVNGKRCHKFNFRKEALHKKYGFDLSMTENEMTKKIKAYKIYDCGLFRYVWKKNS